MTQHTQANGQDLVEAAGRAVAAGAGRKRGSALVIAIGALALIAVFAAVYVTIGQNDTRTAASVVRNQGIDAVEADVASYIGGVIAADRLDLYLEPTMTETGDFSQRMVREAFDYPSTDGTVISEWPANLRGNNPTAQTLRQRARISFSPSGRHTVPLEAIASNGAITSSLDLLADARVASDPWLASTEPSFAGFFRGERTYSRVDTGSGTNPTPVPEYSYMDNRDWLQITNIAPDGRFVNLWNLRNNFTALPGFGTYVDANGQTRTRMSAHLTLLKPVDSNGRDAPFDPEARLAATRQVRLGLFDDSDQGTGANVSSLPTLDTMIDPDGAGPTPQVRLEALPVFTSSRQRYMFFPLREGFEIFERNDRRAEISLTGAIATPGSPDYPDHSYADADGDGMADSRWFELNEGFDPDNARYLGAAPGEYRIFIATRIIDLSGMVNVNTATDQLAQPSSVAPAGISPAEVDLKRLLAMEDPAMLWAPITETEQFAPVDLFNLRLSYSDIIQPLPIGEVRDAAQTSFRAASDYADYRLRMQVAGGGARTPLVNTEFYGTSLLPGRYGYDALRRAIENAVGYIGRGYAFDGQVGWPQVPGGGTDGPVSDPGNDELSAWLSDRSPFLPHESASNSTPNSFTGYSLYQRGALTLTNLPNYFFSPYSAYPESGSLGRRMYYHEIGRIDPSNPGTQSRFAREFGSEVFDVDDLAELLTYRATNDDRVTSRLELVLSGRYYRGRAGGSLADLGENAVENDTTLGLSPLRANRPESVERLALDVSRGYRAPANWELTSGDRVIDAEAMARFALDVRQRITTISGAAPIRRTIRSGNLSNQAERLRAEEETARLVRERILSGENTTAATPERDALFMDAGGLEVRVPGNPTAANRANARGIDDNDFMLADWDAEARIGLTQANLSRFNDIDSDFNSLPVDAFNRFLDATDDAADNGILGSPINMFRYYTEALLPDSGMAGGQAWQPETGTTADELIDDRLATLFYGHRGPELALRLAAHLAANMVDTFDSRPFDQPTVLTVLVDGRLPNEQAAAGHPAPRTSLATTATTLSADNPYFAPWLDRPSPILANGNAEPLLLPGVPGRLAVTDPEYQQLTAQLLDERRLESSLETRRTRLDLDEITGAVTVNPRTGVVSLPNTANDTRRLGRESITGPSLIPPSRAVVNVIGIEAQPFIAEVAAMMVYTDTVREFLTDGDGGPFLLTPEVFPDGLVRGLDDGDPGIELALEDGELSPILERPNLGPPRFETKPGLLTIDTRFGFYEPPSTGMPEVYNPDSAEDINPDLMMQVVAFQLHNPFDQDITLDAGTNPLTGGRSCEYMIEYNGRFFPIAQYNEATGDLSPVTIPANQSMVFYATAHRDLNDLADHWINVVEASNDMFMDDPAGIVREFLLNQFTVRPPTAGVAAAAPDILPVRIAPYNPETLAGPYPGDGDGLVNLLQFNTSLDPATGGGNVRAIAQGQAQGFVDNEANNIPDRTEVRLWRTYTAMGPTGPVEPREASLATPVWLGNDILADRFRLLDNDPNTDIMTDRIRHRLRDVDLSQAPANAFVPFSQTAAGQELKGTLTAWLSSGFFRGDQGAAIALLEERFATRIGIENGQAGTPDDEGATLVRWASVRRPDLGRPATAANEPLPLSPSLRPAGQATGQATPQTVRVDVAGTLTTDQWVFPDRAPLGAFPAAMLERPGSGTGVAIGSTSYVPSKITDFRGENVHGRASFIESLDSWAVSTLAPDAGAGSARLPDTDTAIIRTMSLPAGTKHRAALNFPTPPRNAVDVALAGVITVGGVEDQFDIVGSPSFIADPLNLTTPEAQRYLIDILPQLIVRNDRFEARGNSRGTDTDDPQVNLDNPDPFTTFRMTDLISQLAVGPAHLPWADPLINAAAPATPNRAAALNIAEGEYVTLGEVMAAALGFLDSTASTPATTQYAQFVDAGGKFTRKPPAATGPSPWDRASPAYDVYRELVTPSFNAATPTTFALDRGALWIDRYTPFIDVSLDLFGDPARRSLDAGVDAPLQQYEAERGDMRVGAGVTFAAELLNLGRGLPVGRVNERLDDRLNTMQRGKININTASAVVLRTLPGLTPPLFASFNSPATGTPWLNHDDWTLRESARLSPIPASFTAAPGMLNDPNQDAPNLLGVTNPFYSAGSEADRAAQAIRNPDRAGLVTAYRDRGPAEFRSASRPGGGNIVPAYAETVPREAGLGSHAPLAILEADDMVEMLARNFRPRFDGAPALTRDDTGDLGRSLLSGLTAIRQQPGFESIGELANVTVARGSDPVASLPPYIPNWLNGTKDRFRWLGAGNPGTPGANLDDADVQLSLHTITGPGHDTFASGTAPAGAVALGSVTVPFDGASDVATLESATLSTAGTGLAAGRVADEIANDHDEQLAVLAQLANTVDVRSDTYAAWFVIRGYRRSDVENLGAEDLMIPSIERRFLMVIDRSNVTTAADQPRILLLKELTD